MQHQIKIANPCTENWNKMNLVHSGRYCSSCHKVVRDYTNASKEFIVNEIIHSEQQICARLKSSYLTDYSGYKKQNIEPRRFFLFSFLGLFGFLMFNSKKAIAQIHSRAHDPVVNNYSDSLKYQKELIVIVIQPHIDLPSEGATVTLYSDNQVFAKGISDKNGLVSFNIDQSVLKQELSSISITKDNYYKNISLVSLSRKKNVVRCKLEEEYILLGDVSID